MPCKFVLHCFHGVCVNPHVVRTAQASAAAPADDIKLFYAKDDPFDHDLMYRVRKSSIIIWHVYNDTGIGCFTTTSYTG